VPDVVIALLLVALGIALLTGGGEALVRGAVSLASHWHISTTVIGLTIVAMGTSLPELAVGLTAALGGRGDLAMGNVVGSNIFNVAVILGISASIIPLVVHYTAVKTEWPFMFMMIALCLLLARNGLVGRLEGGVLLAAFITFTAYTLRITRTKPSPAAEQVFADRIQDKAVKPHRHELGIDASLVLLGLVLLPLGAMVLVRGAVQLAELAGWSERVIGLTIVAAGTSLPELATGLVAIRRNQPDLLVANVIGSNIFNVGAVLGTIALVTPQAVNPGTIAFDNWWMLAYAALLFPIMRSRMKITRLEGLALLVGYGVYLWMLL
jgi:cation:H+ antiporter